MNDEEVPVWVCSQCGRTVTGQAGDEEDDLPTGWAEDGDGDLWCDRCQQERDPAHEEAEQAREEWERQVYEAGDDPYD